MSQTYGQRSDFIDFDDGFEQEERENDGDSFEENIRKQLLEFRSGTEREIILEPFSIEKRKIVHRIAMNCSLKSHSIGSGCNRRVVVTRFPHVDLCTYTNARDSEPIVLSMYQKRALSRFLTVFPLGYGDIDLYLRSGNASRQVNGRCHANLSKPMLVPPCTSVRYSVKNFRRSLPTYPMREEILKAIHNHKVTMIVGGTGCGKTTQEYQRIRTNILMLTESSYLFLGKSFFLITTAVSCILELWFLRTVEAYFRTALNCECRIELEFSLVKRITRFVVSAKTENNISALLRSFATACNNNVIIVSATRLHSDGKSCSEYDRIIAETALRKRCDRKLEPTLFRKSFSLSSEIRKNSANEHNGSQFILEDAAERQQGVRIFCTQPRRLPVLAVSARVAKERNEKLGSTVGYHIRLEQKISEQTVLTYCTSGVLLRLLTNDTNASNISHIILDEIHEREQKTDYLLIALRQALKNRDDLRIILMSATMEESRELFKRYFDPGNQMVIIKVVTVDIIVNRYLTNNLLLEVNRDEQINDGDILLLYLICANIIPSTLHKVEMFYLPEILALTDYKHASSFTGGTFFGKTARSLNDDQSYNSFPQVDEFRSENYDDSKLQQGRNNKKRSGEEINSSYEIASSRRIVSSATTGDQLSPAVISQFNSRQICPQISSNSHHEKDYYASYSGQVNLTEMYSKMNIRNSEQNSCYQEPAFYDGYQIYPSHNGLASFNYSQPPPNYVYAQQIPMSPYGMMTPYIGGPQMMYTTYHVVPTQNDCQNYYVMPTNVQDCTQPSKFYISTTNTDGFGTQWNSNGSTFSNQESSMPFSLENIHTGRQDASHSDQEYYVSYLHDRPPYFDPSYVEVLRRTNLDTIYLVDSYMISGGEQWLESVDIDLTVAVINYCMDSPIHGSILVFLPGYEDILAVREKAVKIQSCSTKPAIFTLHSQMGSQDQQRVFEPVGRGYRKVILSTNIAEASLTIDDVVFVIDCGKVKEKIYDHSTRISQLKMTWIAKSNAEQRAGRAGRCRNGYCFRLFTTEDYARMNPTQLPEMKRSAIHEVCLHAKMFAPRKYSVRQFLLNAPEPPAAMAIDRSFEFLEQIGAVFKSRQESSQMSPLADNSYFINARDRNGEPDLTDLRRHIVQLPLCPQLARFLLFGICLKCFNPVLTLVATLSHRDPFILPPSGEREERNSAMMARDIFAGFDYSDHMTFLRIYNAFIKLPVHGQSNFCMANYLSLSAMRMITTVVHGTAKLRLLPINCRSADDPDLNRYSNSWPMIQAAIVAGSYPNIGFTRSGGQIRKIRTSNEVASLPYGCAVKRQASSTGMNGVGTGKPEPVIEYLAFQELSKTGDNLSLRTVTAVPPLTVLLFAGPIHLKREVLNDYSIGDEFALNDDAGTDSNTDECVFALEPWLVFRWKFEDMQLMLKLRVKLMTHFIFVMKQPDRSETEETKELLATINQILLEDHLRAGFAECIDLPDFRERSSNSMNNEATSERSVCRRQLSGRIEEQRKLLLVVHILLHEIIGPSNRTKFQIQTVELTSAVDLGYSISSSEHLSYRPEEKNVITSSHSNEPDDDTFGLRSLPLEEEQVPEDPCTSTLEEGGMTKSRQTLVNSVKEDRNNASSSDDISHVSQEGNIEESTERQNSCEVSTDTVALVSRSGHGHFVPSHFRSNDQRNRRIFRQFVNRSRPQSTRSSDTAKVEEQQEQHNSEEVRERRRENRRRDWHWRKNSSTCCAAPSDTYRMPLAYFRGGGRGKSDRYCGSGFRGRSRLLRKNDLTS
ncbi:Helicase protein [Dirofilaria immitis]|nr:Helicase protein [Dirofilaria immitis]